MADITDKGQAHLWALLVYDRKPQVGDALASAGAKVARTIDERNACDLVLTSVADDVAPAARYAGIGDAVPTAHRSALAA